MNWTKIKLEIRERFLNFETSKGIYLVLASLFLFYLIETQMEVVYLWGLRLAVGYGLYEGLRKIWVNRFAQARKQEEIAEVRAVVTGEVAPPPAVVPTTEILPKE